MTEALRPIVIGIAGGTASGKSTLVRRIVELLPDVVSVITQDNYYRSFEAGMDGQYDFDHPSAIEFAKLVEDVNLLKSGQQVHCPMYDMTTHERRSSTLLIEPKSIVLVEGILVLSEPNLRKLFDLSIFVSYPDDLRLLRRIARDKEERGRTIQSVIDQYQSTVAPAHRNFVLPTESLADITVAGDFQSIDRLTACLKTIISRVGML